MSIYPGDKPYCGTITEKQYLQLRALPTLLDALADLIALYKATMGHDPHFIIKAEAAFQKFKELGIEPPVKEVKTDLLSAEGEENADRGRCTLDYYEEQFRTDDTDDGLMTDLLTDLMCLAHREDLNFDTILASATMHYEEER